MKSYLTSMSQTCFKTVRTTDEFQLLPPEFSSVKVKSLHNMNLDELKTDFARSGAPTEFQECGYFKEPAAPYHRLHDRIIVFNSIPLITTIGYYYLLNHVQLESFLHVNEPAITAFDGMRGGFIRTRNHMILFEYM